MKKRNQWFSLVLVVALLFAMLVPASAQETVSDWHSYNSVVARIVLPEFRSVGPEDFPEIDCIRVVLISKSTLEDGIHFTAILVLKEEGSDKVNQAMALLEQNPLVRSCSKNMEYEQCDPPRLVLNHSSLELRLGETVDLTIDRIISHSYDYDDLGIDFTVDRAIIDDSNLTPDSFAQYGIAQFRPCKDHLYNPVDSTHEGLTSEGGYYSASPDPECTLMEFVDRLARVPGFSDVQMKRMAATGSYEAWGRWKIDLPAVAELDVNKKTATVRGLKPGTATVTVEQTTWDGTLTQTCTITVVDEYQNGDINQDADINVADALLVLQHAVELIELNTEEKRLADLDADGEINAADALIILQVSVGLLK